MKPVLRMLLKSSAPIVPRCREAPTTATRCGWKKTRTEVVVADELALRRSLLDDLRVLDREDDVEGALGVLGVDDEAEVPEHLHHLAVLGQHLGLEDADPLFAGGDRQVLEQVSRYAAALVAVLDEEGDLGALRVRQAGEAADGDDALVRRLAQDRDEREVVLVVDVGVGLRLCLRDLSDDVVEAQVDRPRAEAAEEKEPGVGIVRADWAEMDFGAVLEHDVRLVAPQVSNAWLHWLSLPFALSSIISHRGSIRRRYADDSA